MKKNTNILNTAPGGLIEHLIQEISPAEQKKTDRKMMLAARIYDAMNACGMKKGQLADALNKKPSEVTKWLSGTHNFTAETLWDIGDVLGIEIISIREPKDDKMGPYAAGRSKPRLPQIRKIEKALHDLGEELAAISLLK